MGRIAGITIEIGGDTSNLQKSLKGLDSQLKTTQANLKDIEKLLKMNPASTELLTQKQKNLKDAVQQTKDRLQQLKDAQKGVAKGTPEWDALQREIIATEQDLKKAEKALRQFGSVAAQQMKAAGQAMQNFGNKVQNVGRELSKISAAAAAALAAIAKLGYDTMQSADNLNTLSKQTGVSTDELQKWSYASDLVDVSIDTMTGALKKMKKNMDSNSDAFEELGVNVKNADGTFRDVTDVFYDTLGALSNIDNETERDIKAMDIFGKSADELAGVIDDGGKALKDYGKEAADLGLIMSGDTLDQLNEANDTFDKLKNTLKADLAKAGATLVTTFAEARRQTGQTLSATGRDDREDTRHRGSHRATDHCNRRHYFFYRNIDDGYSFVGRACWHCHCCHCGSDSDNCPCHQELGQNQGICDSSVDGRQGCRHECVEQHQDRSI